MQNPNHHSNQEPIRAEEESQRDEEVVPKCLSLAELDELLVRLIDDGDEEDSPRFERAYAAWEQKALADLG